MAKYSLYYHSKELTKPPYLKLKLSIPTKSQSNSVVATSLN